MTEHLDLDDLLVHQVADHHPVGLDVPLEEAVDPDRAVDGQFPGDPRAGPDDRLQLPGPLAEHVHLLARNATGSMCRPFFQIS